MWQPAACVGVDARRLTHASYPPKPCSEGGEVLEQYPAHPYVRIAQLRAMNFGRLRGQHGRAVRSPNYRVARHGDSTYRLRRNSVQARVDLQGA